MFYKLLSLLGFGWSKWQVVEENKKMIYVESNPFIGYESTPCSVYVDIMRKDNSLTGDVKYKHVKRN